MDSTNGEYITVQRPFGGHSWTHYILVIWTLFRALTPTIPVKDSTSLGGILLKILGPVRKFKLLCLVTCLDYV